MTTIPNERLAKRLDAELVDTRLLAQELISHASRVFVRVNQFHPADAIRDAGTLPDEFTPAQANAEQMAIDVEEFILAVSYLQVRLAVACTLQQSIEATATATATTEPDTTETYSGYSYSSPDPEPF